MTAGGDFKSNIGDTDHCRPSLTTGGWLSSSGSVSFVLFLVIVAVSRRHRAHGDESPLGRGKAALGDGRPLGCCDIHARMLLRGAKVEQRAPTRAVFILLAATRIAFLIVSLDLSFD